MENTKQNKKNRPRYRDDIRSAYDTGYKRGWDDAYDIPKRFGAKTVAAFGYRKGIRNRCRSDKYINQYQRGGKK